IGSRLRPADPTRKEEGGAAMREVELPRTGDENSAEVAGTRTPWRTARSHAWLAAVLISMLLGPLALRVQAANGPSDAKVAAAIERGIAYLRREQKEPGNWSFAFSQDH